MKGTFFTFSWFIVMYLYYKLSQYVMLMPSQKHPIVQKYLTTFSCRVNNKNDLCAVCQSINVVWCNLEEWLDLLYLYTGHTGSESHSLSSYSVPGHSWPPLVDFWMMVLYLDCVATVALSVKYETQSSQKSSKKAMLVYW